MKVLRYREVPEEKYANAFLGYGPEDTHFALELTENFGVDSYDIGEGFGHFGVAIAPPQKVYDTCEAVKSKGGYECVGFHPSSFHAECFTPAVQFLFKYGDSVGLVRGLKGSNERY